MAGTQITKRRAVIRTLFTKACSALDELLTQRDADLQLISARLLVLEERRHELSELDSQICENICAETKEEEIEEVLMAEMEKAEEYTLRYHSIKGKASDLITRNSAAHTSSSCVGDRSGNEISLRLPKLELNKYDGEIAGWISFWSQFSQIDECQSLSKEEKFQYLIQATKENSRARAVVVSFPPSGENYGKAIQTLKDRFGRNDLLIEYYVRELLSLVMERKTVKISILYDKLETQLRALESLNVFSNNYAALLFPLIESCLPADILKVWQRSNEPNRTLKEQMDNLMLFLKREVEGEERVAMANNQSLSYNQAKSPGKSHDMDKVNFASAIDLASLSIESDTQKCVFCKGVNHCSTECLHAQKMSLENRKDVLYKDKRCFSCTKAGHSAQQCRARCVICRGRHVPLLCPAVQKYQAEEKGCVEGKNSEIKREEVSLFNTSSIDSNLSVSSQTEVYLQTLLVYVKNGDKIRKARLLIDSGSQRSYISSSLAEEMNYSPIGEESIIHSLFGGKPTGVVKHRCYKVHLLSLNNDFACNFVALDQRTITATIPSVEVRKEVREELLREHIPMCRDSVAPIDILIGSDIAGKLWTGKIKTLPSGLVAIETCLGWTVTGKKKVVDTVGKKELAKHASIANAVTALSITQLPVSDLWKMETIGITDPVENTTKEEKRMSALRYFKNTVAFVDGRYEVRLPWGRDAPDLPTNRGIAEGRLIRMTRKLKAKPGLYEEYDTILRDWVKEGIVEMARDLSTGHYLPHRPVLKENSTTTKVRPVFDASAKERGLPSLNDCLEEGPNLIEIIPELLLRFRQRKIGITADIKKAFLQISVHPEERDYLKFLWYGNNSEKDLQVLRHARVVFGVTSSPFLLGAVIGYHLEKYMESTDPKEAKIASSLKNNFYVDNLVTSLDRAEEVEEFVYLSRTIMARAGFDLRGWESTGDGSSQESSLLGIRWNRQDDTLKINMDWWERSCEIGDLTKRTILSIIHRIFDPIGLTIPVTIRLKLLIQELWTRKLGWDEPIDKDTRRRLEKWLKDLPHLREIEAIRHLGNEEDISLHVFCDGSQNAYAAVVFIRSSYQGEAHLRLAVAKARVTPLKPLTIPQVELLGTLIGARLLKSVQESLGWKEVAVYCWTDSSTVLAWILGNGDKTVFVRNRVKEIRELTDARSWRHIPGDLNPADLPSRGCTVAQLIESKWWEGPKWLVEGEENWPESSIRYEVVNEHNLIAITHNTTWLYHRFSKYEQIVRMVGWIYRFLNNCRRNEVKRSGPLSTNEVATAEDKIVLFIQKESFEFPDDQRLKSFEVFQDQKGIIRLKTRIVERVDKGPFKLPAVLPSEHPLVKRYAEEVHCKNNHPGPATLLGLLRERFWILKGRQLAKGTVKRCVVCRRFQAKNLDTQSPPLPDLRVNDAAIFEVIGIDLAGPLYIRDSSKTWVALFTCACYRAVHLELVPSLSTEAFIRALRRFIARRGRPKVIICDNGTNFRGTCNALERLDWEKIVTYSTGERIIWRFNPPTASWWGGFWERLVSLVKQILRKTLGKASLSWDELQTILIDCEAVINARPLTYTAEDNRDPIPLTPSMLLQEVRETGVPDLDCIESASITRKIRYLQRLREELRRRFRSEYLGQLTWTKRRETRKPIIGEVVIIGSDNRKRIDWPLARIEQLIPGRDGRVRVVQLKTSSGTVVRPIQRVYPLEVQSCTESYQEKTHFMDDDDKDVSKSPEELRTRAGRKVAPPKRLDL